MPERADKLRVPSLDYLWAHLRANPRVRFNWRCNCSCGTSSCGVLTFVFAQDNLAKFVDPQGRALFMNLRPDPRGFEWGLRFFPGGFRFRSGKTVVSFHFEEDPS